MKKNYPGPGNYEFNQSSFVGGHKTSPSFSVGTSKRSPIGGGKDNRNNPGPAGYSMSSDTRKRSPKHAFGTEERRPAARNKH